MGRTPELLIQVDRAADTPLTTQLFELLRSAVHTGRLRAGDPLPASRRLAEMLGVSRTVVLNAYEQLRQDGYLDAHHGSGTFVRRPERPRLDPPAQQATRRREEPSIPLAPVLQLVERTRGKRFPSSPPRPRPIDFRPGVPAVEDFPLRQWRGFVDDAYSRSDAAVLGYGSLAGAGRLRAEVARRARLTRAIPADTGRVVITTSASGTLAILFRQLAAGDVVAVEDPCHPGVPQLVEGSGATVLPIPVDGQGMRVELLSGHLAEHRVRAVYITPAHHFPTGVRMSQARRHQLLDWARAHDAVIVEHDYDDEFCFGGAKVPALASIGPDRVAYVASFSKTMFPALRIGHVVLPAGLTEDFLAVKRIVDPATPTVEQNALAEFIRSGSYARHLKAMRRLYHRRSTALWEALRHHCAGRLDPAPETAGLQLHARVRADAEEAELLRCALAHGVQVYPAGDCHLRAPSASAELIFGYGAVPEDRIHEGVRRLSRALADCA